MKKVKGRAFMTLLLALSVVIGLGVYIKNLSQDGGMWASYFSNSTPSGEILDVNGLVLYESDGFNTSFAYDYTTRLANYQLIGDLSGNVGTGLLRQFSSELQGYNFITGLSEAQTLTLSIDSEVAVAAYNALAGRNGTVMVMNYLTGEIICTVSTPATDPELLNSEVADGTYINKALSASFVPGSIFKLITSAAAIECIEDIDDFCYYCDGSLDVNGIEVTCTSAHGWVDFETALAYSCNGAYATLAMEIGAETLADYVEDYGLTSSHEIDGITTYAGNFDEFPSYSADLAWSGIGQATDLVNPYAMLRFVSAIANGGTVYEGTFIDGNSTKSTKLINSDTADTLYDMMVNNVEISYGTWNFSGIAVGAKTGTAEVGDGTSHAWITGFIVDEDYPYAFIVIVENSGYGLSTAGPIANAVIQVLTSE